MSGTEKVLKSPLFESFLNKWMTKRNITRKSVAHITRVNEQEVINWQKGLSKPNKSQLTRLIRANSNFRRVSMPSDEQVVEAQIAKKVVPNLNDLIVGESILLPLSNESIQEMASVKKVSFEVALNSLMKTQNLTKHSLGDLIGTSGSSVLRWAEGGGVPADKYKALCELSESIREAKPPKKLVTIKVNNQHLVKTNRGKLEQQYNTETIAKTKEDLGHAVEAILTDLPAHEWLLNLIRIKNTDVYTGEIRLLARAAGISLDGLKTAKRKLGVKTFKENVYQGKTFWRLRENDLDPTLGTNTDSIKLPTPETITLSDIPSPMKETKENNAQIFSPSDPILFTNRLLSAKQDTPTILPMVVERWEPQRYRYVSDNAIEQFRARYLEGINRRYTDKECIHLIDSFVEKAIKSEHWEIISNSKGNNLFTDELFTIVTVPGAQNGNYLFVFVVKPNTIPNSNLREMVVNCLPANTLTWEYLNSSEPILRKVNWPTRRSTYVSEENNVLENAVEFLRVMLQGGKLKETQVKRYASKQGINDSLLTKAKDQLGVKIFKFDDNNGYFWVLPIVDKSDNTDKPDKILVNPTNYPVPPAVLTAFDNVAKELKKNLPESADSTTLTDDPIEMGAAYGKLRMMLKVKQTNLAEIKKQLDTAEEEVMVLVAEMQRVHRHLESL